MSLSVKVTQGQIRVNSVWVVQEIPGKVVILECDTKAKYPECGPFSTCTFSLMHGEYTLHAEPGDTPTYIEIEGLGEGNWTSSVVHGRYGCEIVLVRLEHQSEQRMLFQWDGNLDNRG
jgi:hypothetical protein